MARESGMELVEIATYGREKFLASSPAGVVATTTP
jgi:hypothetical protein